MLDSRSSLHWLLGLIFNLAIMAYLTIKELTDAVGNVTPRMVRHYHKLGLMPAPRRSPGNYRLYTEQDVQRLRRIVALKQQGFQLAHIRQVLEQGPNPSDPAATLIEQLQQQYQAVIQQLVRLRRTATALEGLLGRDRHCQSVQAEALAQLRLLDAQTQSDRSMTDAIWERLDAAAADHPERFADALQRLLPDLSDRSEIEVDLLSQLVLTCGDMSLLPFVCLSPNAIKAARTALQQGCVVVADVPLVAAGLDHSRLAHLQCSVQTLVNDPHVTHLAEAEQWVWQCSSQPFHPPLPDGSILVIGYAPAVLMQICDAIEQQQIHPALVIGLPIGFSHAPAAKRRLMQTRVEFITIEGTMGGGLLSAVVLNTLVASLIEKPDCHCYLRNTSSQSHSLPNHPPRQRNDSASTTALP